MKTKKISPKEAKIQAALKKNKENYKRAVKEKDDQFYNSFKNRKKPTRDYWTFFYILIQIALFVFVIVFFYNCNDWRKQIYEWEMSLGHDTNSFMWRDLFDLSCIIPVYLLFTNYFCIKFFGIFFPSYGNGINRIKIFRNSRLGIMNNGDGKDEYMKTAWLDGLDNDSGKNVKEVKKYVNSRLNSMSNETGYEWLKK